MVDESSVIRNLPNRRASWSLPPASSQVDPPSMPTHSTKPLYVQSTKCPILTTSVICTLHAPKTRATISFNPSVTLRDTNATLICYNMPYHRSHTFPLHDYFPRPIYSPGDYQLRGSPQLFSAPSMCAMVNLCCPTNVRQCPSAVKWL